MNICTLIGRLARDIEIRQSSKGTAIARFSIAVDRRGEGTDFINCKAFGAVAENLSRFFHRGQRIGITGHINTGSYDKDGHKEYTFEVVVDAFDFCEKKTEQAPQEREPGEEDYEDEMLPF